MNTGRRHLDWVMVLLVGVVVLSPAISIIASNWGPMDWKCSCGPRWPGWPPAR